jgi:hypothetical protein
VRFSFEDDGSLALKLLKFKAEPTGAKNIWESTYRFAVVDTGKPSGYPANFVCMLPKKFEENTEFVRMFGDRSVEQAQRLLTDSLKREPSSEVKAELTRRLRLLEPKQDDKVKCCHCEKTFKHKGLRRHRWTYCPECKQKKWRSK